MPHDTTGSSSKEHLLSDSPPDGDLEDHTYHPKHMVPKTLRCSLGLNAALVVMLSLCLIFYSRKEENTRHLPGEIYSTLSFTDLDSD